MYKNDEQFELGKLKVAHSHEKDVIAVVAGGVTLQEALKASSLLEAEGIFIRVVDIFSVKPLDKEGIVREGLACGGLMLVVEDHYENGGIKDSISSALSTNKQIIVDGLGIKEIPRSGTPFELVARFGIDSKAIVVKVKEMLREWGKK